MGQPNLNATAKQAGEKQIQSDVTPFLSNALNRLDDALNNLTRAVDTLEDRTGQFRVLPEHSDNPSTKKNFATFGGSSIAQTLDSLSFRATDSVDRINNIIYSLDS